MAACRRERSCLPQIPGTHQDASIGRGRLGRFFVVQKDNLAVAELQRLGFDTRIDLGINRAKDSFLERGGDDDIAMAAHQRDRRGSECARQRRAELGVRISMSVAEPPASRISNTGAPPAKNELK